MVENVTQINSKKMVNVNVSVKIWEKITYATNILFEFLLHVLVKMVNM